MSDQPASGNNSNSSNNNNNSRRHNNSRRRPHANPNANTNNQAPRPQGQGQGQAAQQAQPGLAQGQNAQGSGGGQRRRPNRNNNNNNRPRNPNQGQGQGQPQGQNQNNNNNGPQGLNIERIYEKYLNLLDQHLVARRKYHDLFYRADHGQKHKLERNFYNTLNDIRDFEDRLAPAARELFEKRNNGLNPDNIYTTNHELPVIGDNPPPPTEWADPHFLHSQDIADFKNDKEESAGSLDDYLKYKNLI